LEVLAPREVLLPSWKSYFHVGSFTSKLEVLLPSWKFYFHVGSFTSKLEVLLPIGTSQILGTPLEVLLPSGSFDPIHDHNNNHYFKVS